MRRPPVGRATVSPAGIGPGRDLRAEGRGDLAMAYWDRRLTVDHVVVPLAGMGIEIVGAGRGTRSIRLGAAIWSATCCRRCAGGSGDRAAVDAKGLEAYCQRSCRVTGGSAGDPEPGLPGHAARCAGAGAAVGAARICLSSTSWRRPGAGLWAQRGRGHYMSWRRSGRSCGAGFPARPDCSGAGLLDERGSPALPAGGGDQGHRRDVVAVGLPVLLKPLGEGGADASRLLARPERRCCGAGRRPARLASRLRGLRGGRRACPPPPRRLRSQLASRAADSASGSLIHPGGAPTPTPMSRSTAIRSCDRRDPRGGDADAPAWPQHPPKLA